MSKTIKGIALSETVNAKFDSVTTQKLSLTESIIHTPISADSIMVDIEGIHANVITRNDTLYTPECLKKSVPYWTNPYRIPIIFQHKEKDELPIGRIIATEYVTSDTRTNTPALVFTVNIAEGVGVKGVQNGNLSTVSISGIGIDVRCSICNQNLAEEGMCEHEKGVTYGKELCYWVIHELEPKELSYVTVPSDKYAHNLRVYKPETKKQQLQENCEVNDEVDLLSILQEQFPIEAKEAIEKIELDLAEAKEDEKKEEEPKEEVKAEEVELDEKGENGDETKAPKEEEVKEEEAKEEEPKEEEKKDEEEEKEEDTVESLKAKIAELEKEIESLKGAVKIEKDMKESLESALQVFKDAKKMEVVESVISMRKELNLSEMTSEELMAHSEDTLDLIAKNLKECANVTSQLKPATLTAEINVSEAKDNTNKAKAPKAKVDVKESADDILYDIMKSIM